MYTFQELEIYQTNFTPWIGKFTNLSEKNQEKKLPSGKKCPDCGNDFAIFEKDLKFYEKISPVFLGKKYSIPTPTLCPECRLKRRLSFRNERKLYKRKCDGTGKDIISMYSPDKKYKVYNQDYYFSDKWNATDYSMEFKFGKTFFEQFEKLLKIVPRASLLVSGNENSDFTNYCSYLKNCYLVFDSTSLEDCYYGYNMGRSKLVLDSSVITDCENVYECLDCFGCYNLFFSQNCNECNNGVFLENCQNCEYCIGCTNLVNKKYYVENVFVGKKKYKKIYSDLKYDRDYYRKKAMTYPKKYAFLVQTENVTGNSMIGSKNCTNCFDGYNFEDCKFCSNGSNLKDCMDCESIGEGAEKCYEFNGGMKSFNILFSMGSYGNNIYYSDSCFNSSNLFGCIGLKNKSYCILNKQYSREEYEKLVPKIIKHMQKTGEWGEFFPSSISPFGYNETVANEYFPINPPLILLNKGENSNEVRVGGFNWSTYEASFPKVEKIIPADKLPENIKDIPDDILNRAILPVGDSVHSCPKPGFLCINKYKNNV